VAISMSGEPMFPAPTMTMYIYRRLRRGDTENVPLFDRVPRF
jgi:hypothetical protein